MTFAEWIREQKDICDKLKEQNYEDQKEIRNFFNDRIKRIFEIDLPKNKSYERIWGDNRDKNKRMYKALYGELKEDDIKFGEGEQRFFRAIFEIFSQSEDINNLKNNKWELYDLQSDPMEMHNLYGQVEYEPVVKELKEELLKLQEQYNDPVRFSPDRDKE